MKNKIINLIEEHILEENDAIEIIKAAINNACVSEHDLAEAIRKELLGPIDIEELILQLQDQLKVLEDLKSEVAKHV